MKKLNLLIPGNHRISFEMENLDTFESKMKFLVHLLYRLGAFAFFSFLFFLPFCFYLATDTKIEASFYMYVLIYMIITAALFLGLILFKKKDIYIDPKGFLNILIFSLLSTISILLVEQSDVANTFGSTALKSLSGLSVIAFLAIFYFSHFFINTKTKLTNAVSLLIAGSFVLILATLGTSAENIDGYIIFDLMVLLPIFLFGLYKNKYMQLLSVLFIFIAILKLSEFTISDGLLFVMSFSLLITNFILLAFRYMNGDLVLEFKQTFASLKNFDKEKILNNLALIVHLILFISALIAVIYFVFTNNFKAESVFETTFDDIKDIWASLSDSGIRSVLFGRGALLLNINFSFFNNLFISQGIVGLIAYLVVISYIVKQIYKSYKNKFNDYLTYTFNLLILFILISSIFVYPGMFVITLLWLFMSFLNINLEVANKNDDKLNWSEKIPNTKFSIAGLPFKFNTITIKSILLILLTGLTIATIYGLFNIKDQIF